MAAWAEERNGATWVTLVGAALFALDWLVFAHLVRSRQHGHLEVFRVVLVGATAIFFVGWLLLLRSLLASRYGVHIVALGVAVFAYDWCLIGYRGVFGQSGDLVVTALAFVSVGTVLLGVLVTLWRMFSWSRNSPSSN